MASKPKLKPCPFCGGEAQLLRISKSPNGVEEWFVSCGSDSCDLYPHSTIPYASAEIAAAAWNRRASDKPLNAAAMREAVEFLQEMLYVDCNGEVHICAADVNKIIFRIRKALSAPPRNCDVYSSVAEARNAFICEPCEHPCGDCTVCDDDYALCCPCGIKWLLAPAKKGGAK